MILLTSGTVESVVRLITSLLIFIFVLGVTYWTSRFIAKYQKQAMSSGNLEVIEATRIAPNKYLQIVRSGERYFLIALGKEEITMISELERDSLQINKEGRVDGVPSLDFKSVLEKAKNSRRKQADKDE